MTDFQSDPRFRDQIFYSLRWAEFLRHNIDGPLIPFMFLYNNDERFTNMLQPGGDPEEFAYKVARDSDRKFDTFIVGYEGKIGVSESEKQDAIMIKGYKLDESQGVFLAQIFKPMESYGAFQLVDDPILIDTPKMPLDLKPEIKREEYQDVVFNGIVLKKDHLFKYLSFYTHDNPASISNAMIQLIRAKLSDKDSDVFSGDLELAINPQNHNVGFLKYTVVEVLKKELTKSHVKEWEDKVGRTLKLNVVYGDDNWAMLANSGEEIFEATSNVKEEQLVEQEKVNSDTTATNTAQRSTDNSEGKTDYRAQELEYKELYKDFSAMELKQEVNRLRQIPNARTNIDALMRMTALMEIMESRDIDLPGQRSGKSYAQKKQLESDNSGKSNSAIIWGIVAVVLIIVKIILRNS